MNINLHIVRLMLQGVNTTPGERHLRQASVEFELTRMFTGGELSSTLVQATALPRLPTSDIQLTSNNNTQLGQQIAKSAYGEIGRE